MNGPGNSLLTEPEWQHLAETMRLSERQTQLCRWALEGLPEKALARELGMSKAGVHYDFKALYIQFDVHDRAELVVSIVRQVKGAHGFGYCD